jgi:hypothetical protein
VAAAYDAATIETEKEERGRTRDFIQSRAAQNPACNLMLSLSHAADRRKPTTRHRRLVDVFASRGEVDGSPACKQQMRRAVLWLIPTGTRT